MQATARRLSVVSATSCARRRLIRSVRPTNNALSHLFMTPILASNYGIAFLGLLVVEYVIGFFWFVALAGAIRLFFLHAVRLCGRIYWFSAILLGICVLIYGSLILFDHYTGVHALEASLWFTMLALIVVPVLLSFSYSWAARHPAFRPSVKGALAICVWLAAASACYYFTMVF
jgi:hypothetical protein